MQRLEISGAVRPLYGSLGVKWLSVSKTYKKTQVKSVVGAACDNFCWKYIYFFLSSCPNKHFLVGLQISVAWQARLHVKIPSRYLALITTKMCRSIFAASPHTKYHKISISSTSEDLNMCAEGTETWRSQRALLSHFRYERDKIVTRTHF